MAIDRVAIVQHKLLCIDVSQADHSAIEALNGLGTRIDRSSILDQAVQLVAIEVRDTLRDGQVHRNLGRNTKLSNRQIRIRRDHRTCREFYTLTL